MSNLPSITSPKGLHHGHKIIINYCVIPNNSGLKALAYFLNKRPVLDPTTSTPTRLAELVLTPNAFTFNGDFYQQIGGVGMGSKMGPNYACLLVGYVEGRIASQYHGFVPQLHKRYIDDVIGVACCSRVELENYIHFVSNFHSALQFTHTISDIEVSFLDITLRITDNHITTRTLTPTPIFIISLHIPAIAKKVSLPVNSCDFAVFVPKTLISWKRAVKWCLPLNNVDTPPPCCRTMSGHPTVRPD